MAEQKKPLVTHIYTADPSAHVFDGKLYIYPSHDVALDCPDDDNGDQYQMEDYHILSMDSLDAPCVDNGMVLHESEVPWVSHQMWAPDAAYKNGKYYLFFPAKDKDGIFRIGVATSDTPNGKFTPEPNYIEGSYSIDPAVLVDDDGRAYMYVGGLWGGQLQSYRDNKPVEDPAVNNTPDSPNLPHGSEPSLPSRMVRMSDDMLTFAEEPKPIYVVDENGNPLAADDPHRFFEASWMHKYNGKYYFSYSTGDSHLLCYATGDNPYGPFTYQGVIMTPVVGWTTHHSIVEYKGKWYLFHHDSVPSGGKNHLRSLKVCELEYDAEGRIKTIEGMD